MKIIKTYQGELPENKILNNESTSQTDTYSCEYINNKQDKLVSGTNIKTINGDSILGNGDITTNKVFNTENTSQTDTYSCDYINKVNACATATITENTTASNTVQKIPLTDIVTDSDLLTLSNGGIRIGAGINKILVSANVRFYTLPTSALGSREATIYKNSTVITRAIETKTLDLQNYVTCPIPPILIEVSEGDVIYLHSYSVQTDEEVSSSANETRLTVEVK